MWFWVICVLMAASVADAGVDLAARVDSVIALRGDGAQVATWYAGLSSGSPAQRAAQWILAWLPPSDVADLDLPTLQEHVAFACDARRRASWRDEVPDDLWLHYVVPHRVSQEPVQAWRAVLARALAPVVAPYTDMEAAALAVNRWCREHATYTPTSGRDMGPLTTLARGLGRCEEEMILTICALRAAGIPARACSTPYWTFTDDNHAWVEVWVNGRWHYAESCDDARCLDNTWFSEPASRAGFVRSVAYGEFTPADEPVYRQGDGITVVNSTAVYTRAFTLEAEVAGAPDAEIFVNVLNYGTLRSIARLKGGGTLALGPGEYALTAADPGTGDLLLQVVKGEAAGRTRVTLGPADRYDLAASPPFWLHYPSAAALPLRHEILVSDDVFARHRAIVTAIADERTKLRTLDATDTTLLDSLPPDLRAAWDAILAKPLVAVSPWVRLLATMRRQERGALTAFLAAADDKDLLEDTPDAALAQVRAALAVRDAMSQAWGIGVPESLFIDAVLPGRIHDEPAGDWRTPLPRWGLGADADATVTAWLDSLRVRVAVVADGALGNPLPPDRTWRLRRGRRGDVRTAFVGLCRRAGVPARFVRDHVEVWSGAWHQVDPLPPDTSPPQATAAAAAWLDLAFTHGGVACPDAEPYRRFAVALPGEGKLDPRWWDIATGVQPWDPGTYVLGAVTRVPGGSACGRLRAFTVAVDETARVVLPMDVDPAGWDLGTLVDADLAADLPVGAVDGGLDVWLVPGEAATRVLAALARANDRLTHDDVPVRIVVCGDDDAVAAWRMQVRDAGLTGDVMRADERVARYVRGTARNGPVILLRDRATRLVLLRAGLDSTIDESVQLALDGLDTGH